MEGTASEKPPSFCGLLRSGRDEVRSHQTQHDPNNSLMCAWQLLHSGTEWVSHLPRVTQLQRPPQSSFLCCLVELGGSIYLLWVQLCQV